MRRDLLLLAFGAWTGLCTAAAALPATSDDFDDIRVGGAQIYVAPAPAAPVRNESVAIVQIAMDRAGISPGVIDGLDTPRFRLALATYLDRLGTIRANMDIAGMARRLEADTGPAHRAYTLTPEDMAGPFTPDIPVLYVRQAELPHIGYRNPLEMLAERFHASEDYLAALNPDADFTRAGTVIRVPSVGRDLQTRVGHVVADKRLRQVRAYDAEGRLVAAYPASIGSRATPSPSGTHTVRNKAENPQYTYDPDGSAQPGLSTGLVRLPAGPNGPVGNAWIGLSKKTYGIHGTPEPALVGLAESVGCVRLTNWDALELARLVRRGVTVTFVD